MYSLLSSPTKTNKSKFVPPPAPPLPYNLIPKAPPLPKSFQK